MDKGSERPKPIVFKRMADGWVYRAPNPWIFGDAPHYFVTDEQKAKIEAIVVPRRPVLFGMMLVAGILAWVFALVGLVWAVSGHVEPTTVDVIAIAVLVAISLVAALPLANWIQRRRLQPVLAGLPLTQERITFAEMRENARTATPFKQSRNAFIASLFGSVGAFAAAYSHFLVSSTIDAQVLLWAFNTVVWGSVAFVWYRRTLSKATETSDAASFVRFSRIVLLIAVSVLVVLSAGLQIHRKRLVPSARDFAMARVQFEAAAKFGDAKAMNRLGLLYQNGLGGTQDYAKAREYYEKAAALGDGAAMNSVGWLYQNGFGVTRDYAIAREWYEKAIAAQNSAAMNNLGWLYQNGFGVPQDYAKAREWFERSAAAGNSSGMNSVGWLYQNGLGLKQDYAKAKEWYEKAANAGNAAGMSNLAWVSQNGWGVPQDYAKARELHEKAAAAGIGFSMDALGAMYINGLGVPKDDAKAREWYEKAAAAGNPTGMQHLASMLDAGKGGPADAPRAAQLLLQSARLGHKWSLTVLDGPLTFLTPSTRIELKREFARLGPLWWAA